VNDETQRTNSDLENSFGNNAMNVEKTQIGKLSEGRSMEGLWFLGAIAIYFALQLWILPKMGIST